MLRRRLVAADDGDDHHAALRGLDGDARAVAALLAVASRPVTEAALATAHEAEVAGAVRELARRGLAGVTANGPRLLDIARGVVEAALTDDDRAGARAAIAARWPGHDDPAAALEAVRLLAEDRQVDALAALARDGDRLLERGHGDVLWRWVGSIGAAPLYHWRARIAAAAGPPGARRARAAARRRPRRAAGVRSPTPAP